MIPNIDQDAAIKRKINMAYIDTSKYMTKASLKVLKQQFGFTPEQLNAFVRALENEIKRSDGI
jgi:uncharacterized tellurite resistance protein B-like protein